MKKFLILKYDQHLIKNEKHVKYCNNKLIKKFCIKKGYVAQVNWDEGTKFGKALADAFVEKGFYKDLNGILRKVNSN